MVLEILITMCYMSRSRESVVSCQAVTAVLLVTAVIIMQLTEGTEAKILRLLPKRHNIGGPSGLEVMCSVQDSHRGGHGGGWV